MVVSVLPKKFHKTLLLDHRFLGDLLLLKLFNARTTSCSLISSSQTFCCSLLKVGSEISLRNSLNSCFVFLSFLLNKFSKNFSNSLLISTKLSISLLSISNFLTVPCVAFVFSRFRKNLVDFSPSSYHWHKFLPAGFYS